jgi:hypothetical protein
VGVLVIHGVGEQTRFEHLESISLNLARAAEGASVDMAYGTQTERHAEQQSWHEWPAIVRWQGAKQEIEAHFREVYWADFGMAVTILEWFRMLWWIMSMPGARVFSAGDGQGQESANLASYDLQTPGRPSKAARLLTRMYLGLVCSIATPFVLFAKAIEKLLELLASRDVQIIPVLMHTLGSVMLYQDATVLKDRLESFNEKRRIGIRRRMVQGLLAMAMEVEQGKLDAFYVVAHSLGTVIAFNSLMECPSALPNFLSREEWMNLPRRLKCSTPTPLELIPSRPSWLNSGDSIDRKVLLEKCKGFLTAGSPLDKFASLWPAIVPLNTQTPNPPIRWVNVADGLDVVANQLHYFPAAPAVGGGFKLENYGWGNAFSPLTAHTSYWTAKKPGELNLMNWIVCWLEDEDCAGPVLPPPPPKHKLILLLWLILLGLIVFLITGASLTVLWISFKEGIHWKSIYACEFVHLLMSHLD